MEIKSKRRKPGLSEVKIFLTSLSIAATFGLWQFLAHQDAENTAQAFAGSQMSQPVQFSQNLVPLPTLIAPPPGAASPVQVSQGNPSRILLGGSAPQASRPAPIARTGSSR
jgi:hypothetical protein